MSDASFAKRLLAWFAAHGRTDLPWQHDPTPYRVWVSEVMLQQTQVATVIPYYQRFMARFPEVAALAAATLDEVLAHWSGLGYYSRARNLHRAAQLVRDHHQGRFPEQLAAVMALPGIGRSTAAAILALSHQQPHPILDGNVKRVLSRHHAVAGWPGSPAVEKQLWQLAARHTPQQGVAAYTQAIMDLGATLCTRSRPRCPACPLQEDCHANALGAQAHFPQPKPRKTLPVRAATLLLVHDASGALLLERRPPAGIWGGLWSLPELPADSTPHAWCSVHHLVMRNSLSHPPLRHTFSHFHLDITPLELRVNDGQGNAIMEAAQRVWYKPPSIAQLGLPAPIRRLLEQLNLINEEPLDDPHGELRQAR
ncbi:MAG TPA: A/G-specific adenine glycosylase [Gammaproteobacteria bacterium]